MEQGPQGRAPRAVQAAGRSPPVGPALLLGLLPRVQGPVGELGSGDGRPGTVPCFELGAQ